MYCVFSSCCWFGSQYPRTRSPRHGSSSSAAAVRGADLMRAVNAFLLSGKAERKGRAPHPAVRATGSPKDFRSPRQMGWRISAVTHEIVEPEWLGLDNQPLPQAGLLPTSSIAFFRLLSECMSLFVAEDSTFFHPFLAVLLTVCPGCSMWSGLFTHLTESWNNFKGLDPDYVTWMDLLQKHGYYTQKYGKLDYTSGHHSVSNRVEAWTRDVGFLLRQEGRPRVKLTGDRRHVRVMEADWRVTDKAVAWIREEAVNLTQPFALYLGLNLPHPYPSPDAGENFGSSTFLTSPYWLEKVTYEAIKIPTWSSLSEMHPVDYYSSYTKNCTGEFTKQEVRNIRAFYYAMCAETDAMLGEIISSLRDTGLLKKTIVMFTSDHGELAMEHRQFYKMSMYEGSAHVPLLVMGPGIEEQQQVSTVVSLVDIYPTVLDLARIPVPQNLSGHSLLPMLLGKAEGEVSHRGPRPPWVLSEFHGCNVNASTYMLRTDRWKYIAYSDGVSVPPQLFDLSADPDELTNVAKKFPVTVHSLDKILRSVVNYPKVSSSVRDYNKRQFIGWKQSLGQNYSGVIANLRWHQDWLKEPKKYENAIDKWLRQREQIK